MPHSQKLVILSTGTKPSGWQWQNRQQQQKIADVSLLVTDHDGHLNFVMKIFLFVLFSAISLCTAFAQSTADTAATRKNSLKINPLSLVLGDVSVFYERMLTKRASLVGGVGFGSETYEYHNANNPLPSLFHYKRATLEYRHYFRRRPLSPTGFYAGVYGRYSGLTLDDYQFDNQGTIIRDPSGTLVRTTRQLYVWMPGAMAGIQTSTPRVVVDLFLGLHYQLPSSSPPLKSVLPEVMSRKGFTPRFGLTIGYRF
ncbi:hypothetical protein SD10_01910 [Spirosoma radiotolerans]|uniref:DUF3575 domain-containing protein n=1 Tax=Spirosoma radiotolerans TaxID=1379870 RepID=A0A0E3ZRU4_9BACT|nr:hypothetical protein SD10_01910 [Spirosoma radiotolerans]